MREKDLEKDDWRHRKNWESGTETVAEIGI